MKAELRSRVRPQAQRLPEPSLSFHPDRSKDRQIHPMGSLRTETELVLKNRRVVPGRLLDEGKQR